VIERWRLSSMSSRMVDEDVLDYSSPHDSPLQPGQPAAPAIPAAPPPSVRGEALRASLLKKPLDPQTLNAPPAPPSRPPVYNPSPAPSAPPSHAQSHAPSRAPANPPGYPPRFR
jgi:hypothetical protein